MRKSIYWVAAVCAMIVAAGCKTTEKNYQQAYDVAVKKRQAATSEPELGIGAGKLQQADGPRKRIVDGHEVYVENMRLSFVDGFEGDKHRYNVAVAAYRMKTNCGAQVSDLFAKGYKAFAAKDAKGTYYVIAGSFDTLSEAARFAADYAAKEKGAAYIGLPSGPLVIED